MAAPARRTIGATVLVVVTLWAGTVQAGGAQIEDKRAEAAAIASKLGEQAQDIVALDKERRRAAAELEAADAAVARAEADLAAAGKRQDEARRLLTAHAQAAYAGGGSVSFLAQMTRATVTDAGARRTYLRIIAGEDRQAIGRLQAAKEDILVRQKSVADARKAAVRQTEAAAADLAGLERAVNAQRALLARANGDLARLIAAEQARRDAEAAARVAATSTTRTARPAGGRRRRRRRRRRLRPPPRRGPPARSRRRRSTPPSPASASSSRATTTSRPAVVPTSSRTPRGTRSATPARPRTIPPPSRTRRPASSRPATAGPPGRPLPSAAASREQKPAGADIFPSSSLTSRWWAAFTSAA